MGLFEYCVHTAVLLAVPSVPGMKDDEVGGEHAGTVGLLPTHLAQRLAARLAEKHLTARLQANM